MATRSTYTKELNKLAGHVTAMGQAVVENVCATGRALAGADTEPASEVIAGHRATSLLGRGVEDACMSLMLLQQPLARDLRLVTAAFRAVSDHGIDGLYGEVRRRIIDQIKSDGEFAPSAPELLAIAKYYERMGDHAQSIADWAIFRATGSYRGHSMGDVHE